EGELGYLLLAEHRTRVHALLKRQPLDELLDYVERRGATLALEVVVDPRDPRVVQPGEHSRLTLEQLQVLPVPKAREVELLYGDTPVLPEVGAEKGARGGALAEYADYVVAVGDAAGGRLGWLGG